MSAEDGWSHEMEEAHEGLLDVLAEPGSLTVDQAITILMSCAVTLMVNGAELSVDQAVAELARITTEAKQAYVEGVAC